MAAPIAESPKLENAPPKPDIRPPDLPPVRDAGIRLILIPAFGIAIPYFVGYFGPYGMKSALYWMGLAWSILISFLIWHGNRFFLLRQRRYYDWFQHPVRKICVLLFANIFYTAPVAVGMLLGWYRVAGFGPDWDAIRAATLCCVVCVVFITHVYETVYLIQQRESDLLAVERLDRARIEAELAALKAQVTPHFLFNSLNTLGWLIERNPRRAMEFNQDLAEVYRYILAAHGRELVPLTEELDFARRYFNLLRRRFGDQLDLCVEDPATRGEAWFLPPISLQTLLENAVKHNSHSRQNPLLVRIAFEDNCVVVSNLKRPLSQARPGARVGLRNLEDRCHLALGRSIELSEDRDFTVRVPVRSVPLGRQT
jgi:hypothetical protein